MRNRWMLVVWIAGVGVGLGAVMAFAGGAGAPASKPVFRTNFNLIHQPPGTLSVISRGYKGDANVLDFSGMVFDPYRHSILAFGGGHATAKFPNSVHEFDLNTLEWRALTEDVPPAQYTAENAVKTADGARLGGVRVNGKISAGSRHTYDGLIALPDRDLLVCLQAQEFVGAASAMPGGEATYRANYQGGGGLWSFDPAKREWSVSAKTGLASPYCMADQDPATPDLIYFGNAQEHDFKVLNLKTQEVKPLANRPDACRSADMSLTFCPDTKSFFCFPCADDGTKPHVFEYNPATNAWTERPIKGEAPNTYSINVVYNLWQKVRACFSNGYFYYYTPADSTWRKVDQKLEMTRLFHHHIYDPMDNVDIAVGTDWTTYAYKFAGPPGSQAPAQSCGHCHGGKTPAHLPAPRPMPPARSPRG